MDYASTHRLSLRARLNPGLKAGVKKGTHSLIWILKIILPISLAVTLLQWTGWLQRLDSLLGPIMQAIELPAEAALPILLATLVSFYAALASMAVIPFTQEQLILVALFIMVAHMLIMEGVVQLKSGIGLAKITLFRLGAAVVAVLIVAQFFGNTTQAVASPASLTGQVPLATLLKTWALDNLRLAAKIAGIILVVMVALESLKALGWIHHLQRFFAPVMKTLGLSRGVATMWVAGAAFGLVYGAAVIREEANKGHLSRKELEPLHISLGINHSMVEDPALLLAFGISPFWSLVPRLLMAALTVHAYRLAQKIRGHISG